MLLLSKKHWVRNGNGNRKGTVSDIDELEQLYNRLIDHLTNTVNYPGWIKGIYPEVYTFAVHPMYLKKGIGKGTWILLRNTAEKQESKPSGWTFMKRIYLLSICTESVDTNT